MIRDFVIRILLINVLFLMIFGSFLALKFDNLHIFAMLLATAITAANTVIGFYYINKDFNADFNTFMSTVFGSMFIRLLTLGGVITLILIFTELPQITFTLSLFISYIYNSVLEFIFVHKKSANNS